jgi:hypothetical protein
MGMGMMNPMMPNMMNGIPMMPNMMNGIPMMPNIMAKITCEMQKDGMICKIIPIDGASMEIIAGRCDIINKMISMGIPMIMMCGGMPIIMATGQIGIAK